MKSFFQFLSESESQAATQARKLGLKGDGHGGWLNRAGEFVAKTEDGKLKFFNKNQKPGKDPDQTPISKKVKPILKTKTMSVDKVYFGLASQILLAYLIKCLDSLPPNLDLE